MTTEPNPPSSSSLSEMTKRQKPTHEIQQVTQLHGSQLCWIPLGQLQGLLQPTAGSYHIISCSSWLLRCAIQSTDPELHWTVNLSIWRINVWPILPLWYAGSEWPLQRSDGPGAGIALLLLFQVRFGRQTHLLQLKESLTQNDTDYKWQVEKFCFEEKKLIQLIFNKIKFQEFSFT